MSRRSHISTSQLMTIILSIAFTGVCAETVLADKPPRITSFRFNKATQTLSARIRQAREKEGPWNYTITSTHDGMGTNYVGGDPVAGGGMGAQTKRWKVNPLGPPPLAVGTRVTFTVTATNDNGAVTKTKRLRVVQEGTVASGTIELEEELEPHALLDLDRPVGEPDRHPATPIIDPSGLWHELWPKFCSMWEVRKWRDHDNDSELSEGDEIILSRQGETVHNVYSVEFLTITVEVSDPGLQTAYFDYWGDDIPTGLTDPCGLNGVWHMVHPDNSRVHNCTLWADNDSNSELSPGDDLTLVDKDSGVPVIYTIDDISTDIEAAKVGIIPATSTWGLAVLALVVLIAGTVALRRRTAIA